MKKIIELIAVVAWLLAGLAALPTLAFAQSATATLVLGATYSYSSCVSCHTTANAQTHISSKNATSCSVCHDVGKVSDFVAVHNLTLRNSSPQTITFSSAPVSLVVGSSNNLSAVATSGLSVTFSTSTSGICSVSGSTVTGVAVGNCVVNANQGGDATYSAATQVTMTIIVAGPSAGSTINFVAGWNLVGNSVNAKLTVAPAFGDDTKVLSVWTWNPTTSKWAFYTPLQADGGAAYAATKDYDSLVNINSGEGFWVNAKTSFTAQLPEGNAVAPSSFQAMTSGWHLVSVGTISNPSNFNVSLNTTPPAAGVVPQNIKTLWMWDSTQSNWYFYAPSLEAQGGTALTDYIYRNGYLDFTSANKTLGPGVGFWVNRP